MANISIEQYFKAQQCNVCKTGTQHILYKNLIHTCNVLSKSGISLKNEDVPSAIYKCENCGHKYLSPIIKDEILNYYYNTVETEYFDNQRATPSDHRPNDTEKFAGFIKATCAQGKVLEIGSGLGFLLKNLSDKGFDCYGVEPSSFASEFSRKELKLNMVSGMLTEATFPGQKFDVIILSDVIEHIPDIHPLFKIIKAYLKEGGKLFILTGNSNSFYAKLTGKRWLYYYSWEHISFYNRNSIRYLFSQYNMEMADFKKISHVSGFTKNAKTVFRTVVQMALQLFKIRKYPFYSMAFDHFIAVAENK